MNNWLRALLVPTLLSLVACVSSDDPAADVGASPDTATLADAASGGDTAPPADGWAPDTLDALGATDATADVAILDGGEAAPEVAQPDVPALADGTAPTDAAGGATDVSPDGGSADSIVAPPDSASPSDGGPIDILADVGSGVPDTTPADVPDTTAPTVQIVTPTAGQVVSGAVDIELVATDNVGVVAVDIHVGEALVATLTSEPYAWTWDTTTLPNGAAVIRATASDSAGNQTTAEVSVTVANDSCGTTVFFNPSQVAQVVSEGVNEDTISSNGYLFTYTRDKLFTGGVGMTEPIGRPVVVNWPDGVEGQAVTVGPNMGSARIVIRRVDGAAFDLKSFTGKLLGNTAATGAAFEIMPKTGGEDALEDPLAFDASAYYGFTFSYDESPNYLGSTAALKGYHAYSVDIFVDFALVALTLECHP